MYALTLLLMVSRHVLSKISDLRSLDVIDRLFMNFLKSNSEEIIRQFQPFFSFELLSATEYHNY